MQAKDVDGDALLSFINRTEVLKGYWVNSWDFNDTEWAEIPHKVLWAKLANFIKKGLLDGCTCGCRGDFTLTPEGKLAILDSGEMLALPH